MWGGKGTQSEGNWDEGTAGGSQRVLKRTNVFVLNPSVHHHLLKVVVPFVHAVATGDFDREQLVVRDEGGEASQGLAPRTSDTNKQGVATWLVGGTDKQGAGQGTEKVSGETRADDSFAEPKSSN